MYTYKSKYTKSFAVTLSLLPAIVCMVIMAVNGSIGAGISVAGAFSLVRFRSVPGTAKEIAAIFLAMCAGLVTGMGYLAYAVLFSLIVGVLMLIYNRAPVFSRCGKREPKSLRITIPEDLNYCEVLDPIMEKYTDSSELVAVKTTNMGSLYRLTYNIVMKDSAQEKPFIDELRCRNGNLEINLFRQEMNEYAL